MSRWTFTPLLSLFLTAAALAGEGGAVASTQPTKPLEGYRFLDHGSWIVTEAHVRTNGQPASIKRKVVVTTQPSTGERGLEESRWLVDSFEPIGPVQPLVQADRRGFDDLGFKPESTLPEQVLVVARK